MASNSGKELVKTTLAQLDAIIGFYSLKSINRAFVCTVFGYLSWALSFSAVGVAARPPRAVSRS